MKNQRQYIKPWKVYFNRKIISGQLILTIFVLLTTLP